MWRSRQRLSTPSFGKTGGYFRSLRVCLFTAALGKYSETTHKRICARLQCEGIVQNCNGTEKRRESPAMGRKTRTVAHSEYRHTHNHAVGLDRDVKLHVRPLPSRRHRHFCAILATLCYLWTRISVQRVVQSAFGYVVTWKKTGERLLVRSK